MKWIFYLVSLVCIPLVGFSFASVASDIQIIIAIQFVTLGIVSFGIGKVIARP